MLPPLPQALSSLLNAGINGILQSKGWRHLYISKTFQEKKKALWDGYESTYSVVRSDLFESFRKTQNGA